MYPNANIIKKDNLMGKKLQHILKLNWITAIVDICAMAPLCVNK